MDDDDELKAKHICFNCVGEAYLKQEIRREGKTASCDYCEEKAKSATVGDLADAIEEAFERHFIRTSDQPDSWQQTMLSDRESDYEWEREGDQVVYAIMGAADIPEEAARDIQTILGARHYDRHAEKVGEETEFADDSYYAEKGADDRNWQESWGEFERALRTEARFFSRDAERHLADVFENIDTMKTAEGRPLVVDVGPNTAVSSLYRARSFQSEAKLERALLKLDGQLGSPPSAESLAGRMNARGISVFYGANEQDVALAEIRPAVGSHVVVGRFDIIRPLRLLDLTALGDVHMEGSVFDPAHASRLERAMFLRSLSRRITKPVMPDDEAFDYLATQAIADYLATAYARPLDGIIYPSVQVAGAALNIVLFHKAARVEERELPKGTEVTASVGMMTEDGWETEYRIVERTPPKSTKSNASGKGGGGPTDLRDLMGVEMDLHRQYDGREPALRLDLSAVRVHLVEAVTFKTASHVVYHWQRESLDDENF